ncbi:ROK family protein [Clostridium fallax]|uniref:Beta-glucoside kinase n=1 Tax=Clostridium fallax TaxID=1533 RepID=A0A1M4XD67_9CLOT|nr:ROK family protein [Clostridium fallax]SHE91477.1 beta-glucoside kinase [Clostridium fallax]SQB05968.1 NagC/XylR family transcriptional regulators [Clostridium fallax]
MENLIGIDIGGTYIKYGILDKSGNILKKDKKETPKKDIKDFIDFLTNIIKEYKKEENIIGVGISIPGFIDSKKGIPLVCSNLRFIENIRIKDILEEKINLPVKLENDANCVALAEKFNGNAINCSDFVCITVGTGIGGGIYINNKLVSGKTFKGGEFCYMITREEKGYERANENSSMMALINMYKDYKGINKEISGYDIFKEAEFDENVRYIIDKWYSNLARLIYNISSVLNPEKVLIGGGISAREDLVSNLEIQLNKIECWHFIEAKIEKCKHRNDSGLIGAAYNFLNS